MEEILSNYNEYNIYTFTEGKVETVDGMDMFDMFAPKMVMNPTVELVPYTVRKEQQGRIDKIMYDAFNTESMVDVDVVLFINNIDNPLNIIEGQVLMLPSNSEGLPLFRYDRRFDKMDKKRRDETLGFPAAEPNRSKSVDPNRTKYLDKIYFPPTVNPNPRASVRTEGGNFLIGGIN